MNLTAINHKSDSAAAKPDILIRREEPADFQAVEDLTREAFYNLYVPGCTEHYLVHTMRSHEDFIPELDLVLELDGAVTGNIMYTKAWLTDETGAKKEILTFGPLCIAPAFQRQGWSRLLIEHSFQQALDLGYDTVVIFGMPCNYVSRGFKSCLCYQMRTEDGRYPAAMMVKELRPGCLAGHSWTYHDSPAMHFDEAAACAYDDTLPKMEKKHQASQDEFFIMSHAYLEE